MEISKISGANVNYINNFHPNPYANIPLNSFGGIGGSKPANTESQRNTQEERETRRNIENSGSMIHRTEEEDIIVPDQVNPRKSVGSNQGSRHSKKSFRDEDFETEKPKSFWAKICCCLPCFKKPENPLLCARDRSEEGDKRSQEEDLV